MDPATIATIKTEIQNVGGAIDAVLGTVDPQLHVPIVIGTAVAKMAPDLVNDVETWIANAKAGNTTDADDAALAAKIAALLQPEGPGLA